MFACLLGLFAGVAATAEDLGGRIGRAFALIPGPGGILVLLLGAIALYGQLGSAFVPLAALIAWLPLQDLGRKLGGNDVRILLVQDLLFAIAVVTLARPLARARAVRHAFSGWAVPLGLFLLWQLVMSIAVAFIDWRLPILAWRLGFELLPLVAIGWLLAQDPDRLASSMKVVGVILAVPCAIGIAQAVFGPTFLAPGSPVSEFTHLELYRGARGGEFFFRPSGPFAEPARYANWCLVTVLAGLCFYQASTARRRGAMALIAIGGLGVFVSGGRAALVVAIVVTTPVLLRTLRDGARGARALVGIASALAVGLVVFSSLYGADFEDRATYYTTTLASGGEGAELGERIGIAVSGTVTGFQHGGVFGQGTGTESLGRQYLYGAAPPPEVAESVTEGGWATIAVELGAIGIALWLWWTWQWRRRLKELRRTLRSTRYEGAASTVMWAWTALLFGAFLLTIGVFQDYVINMWLWGSSGIVAGLAHRTRRERVAQAQADAARRALVSVPA